MAKLMPKKGFWVDEDSFPEMAEIIYTTGDRKGIKYIRLDHYEGASKEELEETPGWATLLWNCVPSQAVLDDHFTFYATKADMLAELRNPTLKLLASKPLKERE